MRNSGFMWEPGAFGAVLLLSLLYYAVKRGFRLDKRFFFIFFYLSTYLPLCYAEWLPTSQLIDLSSANPFVAGIAGALLYEFGVYLWHRAMHKNDKLWKIFHQMHHSAERLDTYGAFYFSPFDMIGFTLLGTVCFSFIAGVPPQSITIILLVTNFFSIFQHANIKTPEWLGYIVQRPESHAIHHARGIHAYNYSAYHKGR